MMMWAGSRHLINTIMELGNLYHSSFVFTLTLESNLSWDQSLIFSLRYIKQIVKGDHNLLVEIVVES